MSLESVKQQTVKSHLLGKNLIYAYTLKFANIWSKKLNKYTCVKLTYLEVVLRVSETHLQWMEI